MKNSAVILFLILFSLTTFAQKPKSPKNFSKPKANKTAEAKIGGEKEEFEKAVAQTNASERIAALQKFIKNFQNSDEKNHAAELIVSARAEIADEKLRLSETEKGVELFKTALKDAPTPITDKLFTEVILHIPTNLFFRGERAAALDAARIIEAKVEGNAKQLLGLATFYLGTENAAEAKRLAEKAIAIEPNLPAAYQTLGLANRLDFQLEEAANAYAKALELDANSGVSKRGLAEMKRALGKPIEAAALYREILSKDETDQAARSGLILSLFDAEKQTEAEAEMAKSLEANPNDLFLLVGAAYWHAARGSGDKAVELASKAVEVEPRYTWAHIALARGLMRKKQPLEAEKVLLAARQYGNFPTLDYELAAVRLEAGFFREAANALKNTFAVKDDMVETRLGGRVFKQAKSFIELLALERRASIFEPMAAENAENAEKLKTLLDFSQKLNAAQPNEAEIARAADEFVRGDDNMKLHRQLYAANRLLEKRTAAPKALELAKAAIGGVNAALDVTTPAAAVLADELYESRTLAITHNELVIVPDIPRQTLSNILRGRIEDATGWALFQQEKPDEAIVRYKRALSVLPEKSAWWRDSMWRLGSALQTGGKMPDALDAYIKSYASGSPDAAKRIVIESLYRQVNGNLDGLDAKIGAKPADATLVAASPLKAEESETVAQTTATPIENAPPPEIKTEAAPDEKTEFPVSPSPEIEQTSPPTPTPNVEAQPTPQEKIKIKTNFPSSPRTRKTPSRTTETELTPQIPADSAPEKSSDIETAKIAATPEIQPLTLTTPDSTLEKKSPIETTSKPAETTKTESKIKQTKPVNDQDSEHQAQAAQKTLFEPVIINVPKTDAVNKPESESVKIEEKTIETKDSATEVNADKKATQSDDAKTDSADRPRIVGASKTNEISRCEITLSQEKISIINNGGSLGVLVGSSNGGDVREIKAASDSPADVAVTFEPEIAANSSRAFFIVKSVSENKGAFTVTFRSPCGKRELSVKVR